MKRVLSILLVSAMLLALSACGGKETLSNKLTDDDDFYDSVVRYLPNEENALVATDADEGGFLIREKRFHVDYKGHILFDVENQTDKSYSLTVHSIYYDREGKRLDEEWMVYSDIGAGHSQYIMLYPDFSYMECKYDFTVKESDAYVWRNDITVEGADLFKSRLGRAENISGQVRTKNDSDRACTVNLQGIYLFDSDGELYKKVPVYGGYAVHPGQEQFMSIPIVTSKDNEKAELPEELADGYYLIPVVSGYAETTTED